MDMVQETVEILVESGANKKRVADTADKVSRERRRRGRCSWRQRVGVRYTWWRDVHLDSLRNVKICKMNFLDANGKRPLAS